jgi:hypothetical protein
VPCTRKKKKKEEEVRRQAREEEKEWHARGKGEIASPSWSLWKKKEISSVDS